MKKHLIAAAVAAAFAVPAMAQVTVGGSINVGIMDTGAAGAKAVVSSLGGGANAINLSSSEDLGGGLRGGFTGQMRFNASTGDMNSASGGGTALLHAANVFLSGGFGTLRLGKIVEAGHCSFDPWGCTGGASLQFGTTTGAGVASQAQASSVSYATPTVAGFSAGIQSSLSTRADERLVLNIGYAAGPLALGFVQADNSAVNGATAFTSTKSKQQSIGVGYNLGVARITLVNTVTKGATGAKTADVMSLGASIPLGATAIWAGYNKDDAAASTADTKWALGVNHALSKRTSVGADVFHTEAVNSSAGFVVRARHTF